MIAEVKKLVLHYDASIELPFAVLAMCALLEFAVFPMVLLLYTMRSFHRCLGYCTRIRWRILHTFIDPSRDGIRMAPMELITVGFLLDSIIF